MRLSELIKNADFYSVSGGDPNIESLSISSADCGASSLYFCISGTHTDGHTYAADAVSNGAVALVTERVLPIPVPQILCKSSRVMMCKLAAEFYGNPARELKLVGITGTNGKTTTSYIVKSIASAAGFKTGLIGTTAIIMGDTVLPPLLTTPDPIDLHKTLRQMRDSGVEVVVMEVSAHALALQKLEGIVFDIAAFSNFTQDHLDFFHTMEEYKRAKISFFTKNHAKIAAINVDDPCGREIISTADIPCFTYGCQNPADVFSINYFAGTFGQKYVLNAFDSITDISFKLPGKFNMYNTLCAALIGYKLGASVAQISEAIAATESVPGRFNIINGEGFSVIVDYAHTPDGLRNILRCVGEIAGARVITVFGCGGDRDREKRAEMGRIAGENSDYTIITSDNPRGEDPNEIIYSIERGILQTGGRYIKLADRRAAISYAVRIAAPRDIILIAGKGDERYMEIKGVKTPFYDVDEVKQAISRRTQEELKRRKACK